MYLDQVLGRTSNPCVNGCARPGGPRAPELLPPGAITDTRGRGRRRHTTLRKHQGLSPLYAGHMKGPARPVRTRGCQTGTGPRARMGPRRPRGLWLPSSLVTLLLCTAAWGALPWSGAPGQTLSMGTRLSHVQPISERLDNWQAAVQGSPQPPVRLPLCPWPFVLVNTRDSTDSG